MTNTDISVDSSRDLTILKTVGRITCEEICTKIEDFYGGAYTKNVLWDFSDADVSTIRAPDIAKMVQLTLKYSRLRPGGKTALIFFKDYAYGIGRMFSVLKELNKSEVLHMTFRNTAKAMIWLEE